MLQCGLWAWIFFLFIGKESKLIAVNFTSLIRVLLKQVPATERQKCLKLRLHVLAYLGLCLRDCCAIFNAVDMSEQKLQELENKCKEYFNTCVLFCGKECVTPTVWTIGYMIPFHSWKLFRMLNYGLGLNTMQGREAKHRRLAKYMENTTNVRRSQRWWTVFRHEYVSLIWLRLKDPANQSYKKESKKPKEYVFGSFIPRCVQQNNTRYCYCGLLKGEQDDEKCFICGDEFRTFIASSAQDGKIHHALKASLGIQ